MTYTIISREEAFAKDLTHFYTGRPCKYGHDSPKFVSTNGCVQCGLLRSRKFSAAKKSERGHFVYPLKNAEDYEKAWAYCQALDIASGHVPATKAPPRKDMPVELPEWNVIRQKERDRAIAESRQEALNKFAPKAGEPYMPKP